MEFYNEYCRHLEHIFIVSIMYVNYWYSNIVQWLAIVENISQTKIDKTIR